MIEWREVRVFISSTFRDMHSERDWLVKRVFPELRERLLPYRMHLVDIDLRWGITEAQSNNDQVLDLCLDQIDKSRPFFVGVLGERYGWVPEKFDPTALSKYGWIQAHTGKSVTELEILYGVLNDPEMRAYSFFYFRDPTFTSDVPESKRPDVMVEDPESAKKLADLKGHIRATGLPAAPMEDYPCAYQGLRINWRLARQELDETSQQSLHDIAADGIVDADEYATLSDRLREFVDDNGTVQLNGLEEFGKRVLEDLWVGIKARYELPDTPPTVELHEQDPVAEERAYHDQFIEQRTRVYIGRQKYLDQLHAEAEHDDENPTLVVAPAGTGKSALLAKFCIEYRQRHPDNVLLAHFVGASPRSTNLREMLRRMCDELKARFGYEQEVPFDLDKLVEAFRKSVQSIPNEIHTVIVIDALNQLDEKDDAHALNWLPREWPQHVDCIMSCIAETKSPDQPVLKAFRDRKRCTILLEELSDEERFAIVTEVPSISAKALDPKQVQLLLKNPATRNPLFLLVALEELRNFGSYEQLNARIRELPCKGDTVTDIFTQVLERLEEEFDVDEVRSVLSWLACSRYGLSENELLELLEGIGTATSSTDLYPILRQLRPYLQLRGDFIDFHHNSLRTADEQRYLAEHKIRQSRHRDLATYFERKGYDNAHAVGELPYHQAHAGLSRELETTLTTYAFLESKLEHHNIQALINDYELSEVGDKNPIKFIRNALELSSHVLLFDRDQLPSQLHGRLLDNRLDSVQEFLRAASPKTGHWLRPRTASLQTSGGALVRTMKAHPNRLNSVAMTCDGRIAACVSHYAIDIYEVGSGRRVKTIMHTNIHITSVALAHDGKTGVYANSGGALTVFDLETGSRLRTFGGHTADVNSIALTSNCRTAVSASDDKTLKVWNLDSGTEVCTLSGHKSSVTSVSLIRDGLGAVSASRDKTLKVWDLRAGTELCTFKTKSDEILSVAASSDGRFAVSGSVDGTVTVWDLKSGKELRTLQGHTDEVNSVALSDDGRTAVSASNDKTLRVWALESGTLVQILHGHANVVGSVALSGDGRIAVSASLDGTLKVWDLESSAMTSTLPPHTEGVTSVALSCDGGTCVSASWDKTLRIWDLQSCKELHVLNGHTDGITCVALTSDGRFVVSASWDNTLKVWDLQSGTERHTLLGHTEHIRCLALSHDGRRAVSGAMYPDNSIKVWDLVSGKEIHTLEGHIADVNSVAITHDERMIVSASRDGTVRMWNMETGSQLMVMRGHTDIHNLVLGRKSRIAVSASGWPDKTLRVWDLESGIERLKLKEPTDGFGALRLMRDDFTAITATGKLCRTWDLRTGLELQTFEGHTAKIRSLELTRDGRRALSGSEDWTLKVWDLESGNCLATYTAESSLTRFVVAPNGKDIIAGDDSGRIHFLRLEAGTG